MCRIFIIIDYYDDNINLCSCDRYICDVDRYMLCDVVERSVDLYGTHVHMP